MTQLTKMASTSSCGCGGGGSCGGCGCSGGSCGGSCGGGCESCQTGPLQRPMFFSGQLLTEEDLQQLSDYAVAKSRLHNRLLHGAGVVCGLQVTCNPCGNGKVTVQPGSALDCCGNDIHLPCATELDIVKMVGALRLGMRGGHDCGDPCEQPCDDAPDDVRCLERKGRRYDLYIRYCETPSDPVTPYVTGGDCSVQTCKPTRITEGYSFELRCPQKDSPPDTLFSRIACCIGDLFEAETVAADANAAGIYGRRYAGAKKQLSENAEMTFAEEDKAQLDATQQLSEMSQAKGAAKRSAEKADGAAIDLFLDSAAALVRYDMQTAARRDELEKLFPGTEASAERARIVLQSAGAPLKAMVAELPLARARLLADATIEEGLKWIASDAGGAAQPAMDKRMYAMGVPVSKKLSSHFDMTLAQQRDWLLNRTENKALSSDCRLRADILAVVIPTDRGERFDAQSIETRNTLDELLLRYLADCICAALNPPCAPCDDVAVKLAGLTVENCAVVKICNLERSFVLSAPAIRYWVPFLHMIGNLFEKACCEWAIAWPAKKGRLAEDVSDKKSGLNHSMYRATLDMDGRSQLGSLMQMAVGGDKTLYSQINAFSNFGQLAMPYEIAAGTTDMASGAFTDKLNSTIVTAIESDDRIREVMVAPLENEIGMLRTEMGSLTAVTVTESQLSASLSSVRAEMTKMGETLSASPSPQVVELRAALDEQHKLSASLEARLRTLEAGAAAGLVVKPAELKRTPPAKKGS